MVLDKSFFEQNGYDVIDNYITDDQVVALKSEIKQLITDMKLEEHRGMFITGNDQVADDYFMESADKIRFFFEKDAMVKGELVGDKFESLNKIGHALHWLNPVFKSVSFNSNTKELVKDLDLEEPVLCQSMYIFKLPDIGAIIYPHQDATYLFTTPQKVTGIWIALEDTTIENGCLWFIPGSHKEPVTKRMIRNPDSTGSRVIFRGDEREYKDEEFVPVPIKKGAAIILHGQVVHKSGLNNTSVAREIYTYHIIETKDTEWDKENWLQPTETYSFPNVLAN